MLDKFNKQHQSLMESKASKHIDITVTGNVDGDWVEKHFYIDNYKTHADFIKAVKEFFPTLKLKDMEIYSILDYPDVVGDMAHFSKEIFNNMVEYSNDEKMTIDEIKAFWKALSYFDREGEDLSISNFESYVACRGKNVVTFLKEQFNSIPSALLKNYINKTDIIDDVKDQLTRKGMYFDKNTEILFIDKNIK